MVVYGVLQLLHGNHVPGVPLNRVTPDYVWGHALWTYLAGVVYLLAGSLLLVGRKTRAAATWIGLTVLLVVLVVYVPFLQRAFGTTPLSAGDWLFCVGVASSVLWIREATKAVERAISH